MSKEEKWFHVFILNFFLVLHIPFTRIFFLLFLEPSQKFAIREILEKRSNSSSSSSDSIFDSDYQKCFVGERWRRINKRAFFTLFLQPSCAANFRFAFFVLYSNLPEILTYSMWKTLFQLTVNTNFLCFNTVGLQERIVFQIVFVLHVSLVSKKEISIVARGRRCDNGSENSNPKTGKKLSPLWKFGIIADFIR